MSMRSAVKVSNSGFGIRYGRGRFKRSGPRRELLVWPVPLCRGDIPPEALVKLRCRCRAGKRTECLRGVGGKPIKGEFETELGIVFQK